MIGQRVQRKAQAAHRRAGLQQQPQFDQVAQKHLRLLAAQSQAQGLLGHQGAAGQGVAELQRLEEGLATGTLAVASQGHHPQCPLHQRLADHQPRPAPQGWISWRVQPPHVAEHQLRHRARQQALLTVGDHVVDEHLGQQHRDRLVAHDPLELRLGRHQVVFRQHSTLVCAVEVGQEEIRQAIQPESLRHDPAQGALTEPVVVAAACDHHKPRRQGRQQLFPGGGGQLREVIHDRDQPLGSQQGLDQLRCQLHFQSPGPSELAPQPTADPIGHVLPLAQCRFDQHWDPHHPAGFSLQPPASNRIGQARLSRAADAAEQQHVTARRRQQGFKILRSQKAWALCGRSSRRGDAYIQRHVYLARLHGGQAQKGPFQPGVVPLASSRSIFKPKKGLEM